MKHDILNHLGEKIGELELPDDTSQEVIAEKLAKYAQPPVPPAIPDVTPRQIRQAIVLSGLATIAEVEAALNALPEPMKTLATIEWEYSTSFQRHRPLVVQTVAMLGLTSEQADNLWLLAASL